MRTISALTGVEIPAYRFLEDSLPTEFDNGPVALSVQEEQAESYENIAWEVAAAALAGHRDRLVGSCADVPSCRADLLAGFAARLFRRPLTDEETARYGAVFDLGAEGGLDEALLASVAALLQAPSFLYRTELGIGPERRELDGYEIASQISYFLTGEPPDEPLLEAARSGTLSSPEVRRAQGARLLETAAGRAQISHFLDAWLGTTHVETLARSPIVYQIGNDLMQSFRVEADAFYAYVAFDSPGRSLKDLFTSNVSFVNQRLARHLRIDVTATDDDAPVEVELDPATRSGVFTRFSFLVAHGGYDSSNPIARGVFVLGALLCAPPPAPPPGIPRVPDSPPTVHTTRDRFAAHTADPFCQNCHNAIDGIGFGFEEYDGIGDYRTKENGYPVDASGRLVGTRDADGPFVGVAALSARLAASRTMSDCFVRQMFRYASGTGERPEDEAEIGALARDFDSGVPITELALRMIERPYFVERESHE